MTERDDADGWSRREVLGRAGVATAGLALGTAAVPRVASANVVETIAFCGCSQVVVYGSELTDGKYTAVLYCGDPGNGYLDCAPLTGTATRVNYEIDDEDCKIIGIVGTTNPDPGEDDDDGKPNTDVTFSVCNQYGPQRCAEKALADVSAGNLIDCLVQESAGGENEITIDPINGERAEYRFEVNGSVEATDNVEDPDDPGGDNVENGEVSGTVDGVVGGGRDTYLYEGEITSFTFDSGEAQILINERQVNLVCRTDLDYLGIQVRSGGCGPQNPDRGRDEERGEDEDDHGRGRGHRNGRDMG